MLVAIIQVPVDAQLHHFVVDTVGGGDITIVTAGQSFFIEVLAKDSLNNTVTDFTETVTISSSGTLLSGGGITAPFIGGVLASHEIVLSKTGATTITATRASGGSESGTSNAFTVLPAMPTKILVETAPDGSGGVVPAQDLVSGNALNVFAVERDAFDNFVANAPADNWSLENVTGGITGSDLVPSGDSTSATFTGHFVGTAQIKATAGLLNPTSSGTLSVIPGSANHVVFTQQPSDAIAGATITPTLTVQLKDSVGNDVHSSAIAIGIALTTGTGSLSGTLTQSTNGSGLAAFNDLSINIAGTKRLTASSAGLIPVVSNTFTISPGTLNNFLVESSGGGSIPTQTMGTPFNIKITARDLQNNTVTSFSGSVDITSTGTLSQGGGTTAAFTSGVLSSHTITIANAGTFTVTATLTGGSASGTSNAFTVNNPLPTTTSITPATKTLGESGFTMTINGTNFLSTSVVRFNGANRTTTFVNGTQLTTSIPASDLTTAGTFPITVFNPAPGGGTSNSQNFRVLTSVVNIKVILQGAYSGGTMNTTLKNTGLLPLLQPYKGDPWFYSGTESVGTIPANIVDWLLIEARTGTRGITRVGTHAAFLRSDGVVVDMDGASPVAFPGISIGSYYIVVKHRNHLAIMSAGPVALNDSSTLYDFTTSTSTYYGADAKNLGGGRFGMYGGDYSQDGFIDSDDFAGPDNDLFKSGYRASDLNLDGFVDSDDFINPDNNVFKTTHVPN